MDGTTHKKINYEARHIAIRTIISNGQSIPIIFFLGVDASSDHTSETQIAGWMEKFEQIRTMFNNSPLAK